MSISAAQVLLIIPCFNEAQRLDVTAFQAFLQAEEGHQLCFADDGSQDGTNELLQRVFAHHPRVHIFQASHNMGKAAVIRAAALDCLAKNLFAESEWIGFWDADLATPLTEVSLFLRFRQDFAPQAQAIFGSRVLRLGAQIKRSALRHYLGRAFATVAASLLNVRSYDSQCGAKLFRREIISSVFSEHFISRWVFDLEILLRVGESNVVECPVSQWQDMPGSKVKILREIVRVFADLLRIRRRYRR